MKTGISRRRFLAGTTGLLLLTTLPPARAARGHRPRELSFFHTHTGERLQLAYHNGSDYLPDALREIARFLRDFRTGDIHPIDPGVLDILWNLRQATDTGHKPFQIISGYRSPATNAMLRKRSNGVAKRSLHMQGKAIDIRLEGYDTRKLYQAACGLKMGGVGCYSRSGFIHVDTGRVRTWGS